MEDNNLKNEELNNNDKNEQNANKIKQETPQSEEELEISNLQKKINDQKEELKDKDDRIKRLMAEFENFKKREDKERQNLYSSVMGDVVTSLLPVIDNLEKAVQTKTEDEKYKSGIEMCLNQLKDILKANGVTEIEAVGKQFDPSLHEAVSSVQDDSLGTQIVKQEYRKGYMIGDKVLRHSLVVVAN